MKEIELSSLSDPDEFLSTMLPVYQKMLIASTNENNLRAYCISRLMISTLEQAKNMLLQFRKVAAKERNAYYCYIYPPRFYYVEDSDTIADIVKIGNYFIHNPAMA